METPNPVAPASPPPRTAAAPVPSRDAALSAAFLKNVHADTAVRAATKKALKVSVNDGVVTLTGTTVSENERAHLNGKLKHFPGFVRVINSLELKPE